jgi:cyclophilin family peptidyl-prolyl cis-trans isomerase
LTFQLFQNLTPNTVSQISNLTTSGDFVNTFKYFSRVVSGFPDATHYVVQGGSPTLNGAEPNPPTSFANENLQQLAFTGTDQLAMANSGGTNSNTTQFFITTGSPNAELGYNYTIFGQLLTGLNTLTQMTRVPVMANTNPNGGGEVSQPDAPLTITSATLTNTNPNGVAIIDTTQAMAGQTATIKVTATDSVDHTTSTQSFTVTVGAYAGPPTSTAPTPPAINFKPFASAVTTSLPANTPTTVQLVGTNGYPVSTTPSTLSYSLVSQPAHGTITNFNSTTGSLTYTPNKNYVGRDSFQYQVNATGPKSTPAVTMSNPATVSFTIGTGNTGAVRVVGTSPDEVLLVTPVPRRDRGTNTIDILQVPDSTANGGSVIEVVVNGVLDQIQPGTGDLVGFIVYGGNKAKNHITIDPSVTLPATIDGGHGYRNRLTGGSGETAEHGWFGNSVLIGGAGINQLIGLAGHVKFKPSKATIEIFAGVPHRRTANLNPVPPGGTFYKFVKGHLVPIFTF